MNSKETSKADNNMASKNVPLIESIDFQVNKWTPEYDTSESKNSHFLMTTKIYPHKQLSVNATTTAATIRPNRTNDANTNT